MPLCTQPKRRNEARYKRVFIVTGHEKRPSGRTLGFFLLSQGLWRMLTRAKPETVSGSNAGFVRML